MAHAASEPRTRLYGTPPIKRMRFVFHLFCAMNSTDAATKSIDAGIRREIGFLTPVMSEGEFEEKAKGLDIISMIRMEG